jgi:hypothetical protein
MGRDFAYHWTQPLRNALSRLSVRSSVFNEICLVMMVGYGIGQQAGVTGMAASASHTDEIEHDTELRFARGPASITSSRPMSWH